LVQCIDCYSFAGHSDWCTCGMQKPPLNYSISTVYGWGRGKHNIEFGCDKILVGPKYSGYLCGDVLNPSKFRLGLSAMNIVGWYSFWLTERNNPFGPMTFNMGRQILSFNGGRPSVGNMSCRGWPCLTPRDKMKSNMQIESFQFKKFHVSSYHPRESNTARLVGSGFLMLAYWPLHLPRAVGWASMSW
jgi:hypothetical protein